MPVRTVTVWCLDWPIVALGQPLDEPVAIVHANRVVSCSPASRTFGVQRGQRRREAQGRCPDLVVYERDVAAEARAFEPVVRALDAICPQVEITRPGMCAFASRGPSRYFGGDRAMAAAVVEVVADVLAGRTSCRVGVADGPFTAGLAAKAAANDDVCVVDADETTAFLTPLPIGLLEPSELADVLWRLGIRTLGALAALSAADVVARFGADGERAHRLASGLDGGYPAARYPPPDLEVVAELEPPVERVDQAAFVGKSLADDLEARLRNLGVMCTRIAIVAETEHGEELVRLWRHEGALSSGAIADRVRWQLDGWLAGSAAVRPTGGLTRIAICPDEVVPARGRQLGFWGGDAAAVDNAVRAVARVQGLLGPEAVTVPERRGGRSPDELIVSVPAEAVDLEERAVVPPGTDAAPWPGGLPAPLPTRVHPSALPLQVVDGNRQPVQVSGRGAVSAPPSQLSVDGKRWHDVVAWAGPWPVDERWWDPASHRRRARFQVVTDDGVARLISLEAGSWGIEATYD